MSIDLIVSATLGTLGWLGLLARNYYSQMANLRIEEARQSQINEQRRIEKQEGYFERLFQLFTLTIGEEKDERIAFQHEMTRVAQDLSNSSRSMEDNMKNLAIDMAEIARVVQAACDSTIRE